MKEWFALQLENLMVQKYRSISKPWLQEKHINDLYPNADFDL
jgi:hypothetical protein